MIDLTPHDVTPALIALFDDSAPTFWRAMNVLDGTSRGQIIADHPNHPTWAAVREAAYGTLYLGGTMTASRIAMLVNHFRAFGDVGLGCWPDSSLADMLPPSPDYDGRTLYFTQRSPLTQRNISNVQLPSGYRLHPRDRNLLALSPDYESTLAMFGSDEAILAHTYGYMLLHNGDLVCEAATGPPTRGWIEIGVTTHPSYRRRGYALITCAQLIRECEARGYRTWWDCATQNTASVALAHALGYHSAREYRYLLWSQQ